MVGKIDLAELADAARIVGAGNRDRQTLDVIRQTLTATTL
jgi:hypothetical protein